MASAREKVLVSVERGAVFYYSDEIANRDGSSSKKSRYYIILNTNPKTDDFLIVVTITKQIENQTKYIKQTGEDPSTLVPVSMKDFPRLTYPSIVSCNKVYVITLENLIKKIENGGSVISDKLPKTIIDAIVSGVLKSKQIEGEYKSIIL